LSTNGPDRAAAWSRQLAQAHSDLRQRLRVLRSGLGGAPAGDGLREHCQAFCSALSAHHAGEDGGMFAELLRVRPDLAGAVRKLTEDHQLISGILARVEGLAAEAATASPQRQQAIDRELGGLAAIMESHFGYEERAIGAALDGGVHDTGWSAAVFRLETQPRFRPNCP
jgi:hemerythrin HHE cation binding domain-containing protein